MGSGDRVQFCRSGGCGIGLHISRFPFALTINLGLLFWNLSIGFGKGYDQ